MNDKQTVAMLTEPTTREVRLEGVYAGAERRCVLAGHRMAGGADVTVCLTCTERLKDAGFMSDDMSDAALKRRGRTKKEWYVRFGSKP